jgi:hypothetical protein
MRVWYLPLEGVENHHVFSFPVRPVIKNEGHLWIKSTGLCPLNGFDEAVTNAESLRIAKNGPHIASYEIVVIFPRTAHAISGHARFENCRLKPMTKIIGLCSRPAFKFPRDCPGNRSCETALLAV